MTTSRATQSDEQLPDDPEFDFKQFDGLTPEQLVRALAEWQYKKEAADIRLKQINKVYDFLRITRIPNEFDAAGIEILRLAGIGRCALTPDMHVSIAAGHQAAAFDWLRDTGRGSLIKSTVNSSSLKASVKEATIKGEQLPEGVFKVNPFTRAAITRT